MIHPLRDLVLVKQLGDFQPQRLIITPEAVERNPHTPDKGEVIAVGPKVKYLKVGDEVIYSHWAGYGEGNEDLFIPEDQVIGIKKD